MREKARVSNPLIDDATLDFMLDEVVGLDDILAFERFTDHDRESLELHLRTVTRFARDTLYPTYQEFDTHGTSFDGERVTVHPKMKDYYPSLVELGLVAGERPFEHGGHQLPRAFASLAAMPLMAANCCCVGYAYLTGGSAHLIETFGTDEQRELFMTRMYEGDWTGTMSLTEPQAGSALADLTSCARKAGNGHEDQYFIKGSKIFISGGDQDFSENIVHLTLARLEGGASGSRGVSLFAVPRLRPEGDKLVFNDVHTTQAIHKIGWKGLPSVGLNYGENDDCIGWLIGEPGRGLKYMFQMMNGARIFVGAQAAATASVAYQESLSYARERKQGRALTQRDPDSKPIAIIEHADVRRMLLRQKAITEGSICLVLKAARMSDMSENHPDEKVREELGGLLSLLTPIVKSFPAEWGYESNILALQVHGGYGYSSEYPAESWARDQKLNTIHEGTTGIQGLDLLGRKVVAKGGRDSQTFIKTVKASIAQAREAELPSDWCDEFDAAIDQLVTITGALAMKGMSGKIDDMMSHSDDYLRAFSILTVAWCWLDMAIASKRRLGTATTDEAKGHEEGRLRAAQYWIKTEVPRVSTFLKLCADGEGSYVEMRDEWF